MQFDWKQPLTCCFVYSYEEWMKEERMQKKTKNSLAMVEKCLPIIYKILSNVNNNGWSEGEPGREILDPAIKEEPGVHLWVDSLTLTLMSAPDRSSLARMRSSRVTSSATVMRLVWIWKILLLVFSSGRGNSIFRSILPEEEEGRKQKHHKLPLLRAFYSSPNFLCDILFSRPMQITLTQNQFD